MITVIQVLEATTGGTRRHMRELLCGLDRRQIRQELVYSDLRDVDFTATDLPVFRQLGISRHRIRMLRRPAPLADAAALFRLISLFRRRRPDIVHAHSAKAGFLARLAARLTGVPKIIYTPHGFAFAMDASPVFRRLYLNLERLAVRWTDTCICLCRQEMEVARQKLGYTAGQLTLVPNGVAGPGRGEAVCSSGEEPAGNGPVIGFLGRFCPQKGPDILAAAAPSVAMAAPGTSFRFVGDGPWQRLIERRLRTAGSGLRWRVEAAIDQEAARRLPGEFDILALPSRWEGMPYVLLDAMAAGTPVVASAVGAIPEIIRHGREGLLVAPGQAPALADALARLAGDCQLRRRLAREAARRVAEFSLDKMLERTWHTYTGKAGNRA